MKHGEGNGFAMNIGNFYGSVHQVLPSSCKITGISWHANTLNALAYKFKYVKCKIQSKKRQVQKTCEEVTLNTTQKRETKNDN